MSACLDRCSTAGLALGFAILVAGLSATAFVPVAHRIAEAMAVANSASGRAHALQLDITLRVADREPIGTGKLLTHPHGLARLELRDAAGRVERHIRVVAEHAASRRGREVEVPRAFLPPLSFLQVDSSDTLLQALSDYGLDAGAAALTQREREVLKLLASGISSTDDLAAELFISNKTVKNHLANIYEKLAITDRAQAVVEAIRLGLHRD